MALLCWLVHGSWEIKCWVSDNVFPQSMKVNWSTYWKGNIFWSDMALLCMIIETIIDITMALRNWIDDINQKS